MIKIPKKTQEEFEIQIKEKLPYIKIIGKYNGGNSTIECKCLKHNYIWNPYCNNLVRGHGCPVCSGRTVKIGLNDMLTTHPEIKPYLVNIEDGYLYTAGSHTYIDFKCPDCNTIRNLEIKSVLTQGFSCSVCGDGISYPNKFARGFLKQLNLSRIEFEYSPDWAGRRSYDNYFEYNGNKYILEMDGIFHYKDNTMSGLTKEEAKYIDDFKDNLAKQHNITIVRIDCRKSDPYFIQKNIRKSILNQIFNLDIIDWSLCNQCGNENIVKCICEFYQLNKIKYTRAEISERFSIGLDTLSKYIKIGKKAGWIKDDIDKSLLASIHVKNPRSKRTIVKDIISNDILYDFKSINLCVKYFYNERNITLSKSGIKYAIAKKDGIYNGYKFEYVN